MSYAHSDDDIQALLDTYADVFPLLTDLCQTNRPSVFASATRHFGLSA
jgi:hypothetical protein